MATYYQWRRYTLQNSVDSSNDNVTLIPWPIKYYFKSSSLTVQNGKWYFPQKIELSDGPAIGRNTYFSQSQFSNICYKVNEIYGGDYFRYSEDSNSLVGVSSSATEYVLTVNKVFDTYVYSTDASAYPNGGTQGSYYYDQRTTITSPTAPTNLQYPNPITTPNVTVSWGAATSNVPEYSVSSYEVSYSINGGSSWTVAGTTAATNLSVALPTDTTSVQFRVRAQDSNGQWGTYVTGTASNAFLAPTLTVPSLSMQGQDITVNWTAIPGADSYTLQRKADTDPDWVQVSSGPNLTFTETVGSWTSVQYQVQAVFSSGAGGWATSASIPVVSASALVISGTDGNLGTLTADVPYTISSDAGNPITLTRTVNGVLVASATVQNGFAYNIPVMDLPTGTGTIVITATVQATGGQVSTSRTWAYTKTPVRFPNTGSTAQLQQEGQNVFPATLAECVRVNPALGGSLDKALDFLSPSVGQVPSGPGTSLTIYPAAGSNIVVTAQGNTSQTGSGDPSPDNIRPITTVGTMLAKYVTTGEEVFSDGGSNWAKNPNSFYARPVTTPNIVLSADGADVNNVEEESIYNFYNTPGVYGFDLYNWNNLQTATSLAVSIPGCTTTQEVQTYLAQHPVTFWYESPSDPTSLYAKIAVKDGNVSRHLCLPLHEPLCDGDYVTNTGVEYHSKRFLNVTEFMQADGGYSVSVPDGADGSVICNVFSGLTVSGGAIFIRSDQFPSSVTSLETANQWLSTQPVQMVYPLAAPVTYQNEPVQLVANPNTDGSVTISGENTVSANWTKPIDWLLKFSAKIETGSYVGTGTYGASSPTSLTFNFQVRFLVISPASNQEAGSNGTALFVMGAYCGLYLSDDGSASPLVLSGTGNAASWYSQSGTAIQQQNVSGRTYNYIAFG